MYQHVCIWYILSIFLILTTKLYSSIRFLLYCLYLYIANQSELYILMFVYIYFVLLTKLNYMRPIMFTVKREYLSAIIFFKYDNLAKN